MTVLFCKRGESGLPERFSTENETDFDKMSRHWKTFGANEEQCQQLFEGVVAGVNNDPAAWKRYMDRTMGW